MPFDELRVRVPEAMQAEYDTAVQGFLALSQQDMMILRQIFVLGPQALDMGYYGRLADSGLICRIATSTSFLMACTLMGGMICKAHQDHIGSGSI